MEANCVCDSIVVAMADLTCRPENMNERWQSCVDRCVGEEKEERHDRVIVWRALKSKCRSEVKEVWDDPNSLTHPCKIFQADLEWV